MKDKEYNPYKEIQNFYQIKADYYNGMTKIYQNWLDENRKLRYQMIGFALIVLGLLMLLFAFI